MKKTSIIAALVALGAATTGWAGPSYMEPIRTPMVSPTYGVGPYWGIQGGANFYQDYEGTLRGRASDGSSIALEIKENIGGWVGGKWGYAWDGGSVRPALEIEGFYNGLDFDLEARQDSEPIANTTGRWDTGAFMVNGLLRFGDPTSAFQAYAGLGVGFWIGQREDTRLKIKDGTGRSIAFPSGDTESGFAGQVVAGFDYSLSDSTAFFMEYKFLNYFDTDFDTVGQQLGGAGFRFFY